MDDNKTVTKSRTMTVQCHATIHHVVHYANPRGVEWFIDWSITPFPAAEMAMRAIDELLRQVQHVQ